MQVCVFYLPGRARGCLLLCTCLCLPGCVLFLCPFISNLCQVLNSSTLSPPRWISSLPPLLPSFVSELSLFSSLTARLLNFHSCCLFLVCSSLFLHCSFNPYFATFLTFPLSFFHLFFYVCLLSSECCWRRS